MAKCGFAGRRARGDHAPHGEEPRKFLEEVARRAGEAGYVAILEVCGFHDWLTELLPACGCREVVLIQPDKRSRRRTDRRDAHAPSEIRWLNREALFAGRKVKGVRRGPPLLASVPGGG